VTLWPRDLSAALGPAPGSLPGLRALVATRVDQRLVRASSIYSVLLDKTGVAAVIWNTAGGGVLGEHAMLLGNPSMAEGVSLDAGPVVRIAIPARLVAAPPLVAASKPVSLPAELRDLPDEESPSRAIETDIEAR
jgi:hypothetical protein